MAGRRHLTQRTAEETAALRAELAQCLVLNTVAAARSLIRSNDARFKPFGVTVQQFSLLSAIGLVPGEPAQQLAQRVALDRTSLLRNLDVLERKGLVERIEGAGNARRCRLSGKGETLLEDLLAEWRAARAALGQHVTEDEARAYLKVARLFSGM